MSFHTPAHIPASGTVQNLLKWYSRGDLNPQGLLHMDLNHTRLPIPPPEHVCCHDRLNLSDSANHIS